MYSESDTDDWSNVGDDYIDDDNDGDHDDGVGSIAITTAMNINRCAKRHAL